MTALPGISKLELAERLSRVVGLPRIDASALERLAAHCEALGRWAPRVDLVGPGAWGEIVERHYAEALAIVAWLPGGPLRLVDLGSGAGFPGLVLAAARPDLDLWLVEPRQRRAAFLAAAARRMELSPRVLGATVSRRLPADFPDRIDRLTVRALRLDARTWAALAERLAPGGRLLSWSGERAIELPALFVESRAARSPGSERRFVREYRLAGERT